MTASVSYYEKLRAFVRRLFLILRAETNFQRAFLFTSKRRIQLVSSMPTRTQNTKRWITAETHRAHSSSCLIMLSFIDYSSHSSSVTCTKPSVIAILTLLNTFVLIFPHSRGSFYARSNHLRSYANDNFNSANYRKLNRTDTEVKKTKTPTRNVADKGTIRKPIQQYHSNSRWITSIANPVSIRQHSANFTNNRITDAEKTAQSRNNYTSPGTTTRKETLLETTTITNPAFVIHRRINDLDEIELEHGRVVANPAKLYENSDNSRRIVNSDTTGSTETVRLPSTDHLRLRVIAQTYRQPAILINNQLRYTSDEDRRYDIAQSIPTTALPYLTHQQLLTTPKAPNYPIFIVGQLNSIFDTNGRHEKYRSSTVNPYSSNIVTRDVHQSALKVIGLDPSVTFRTVDESLTSALSLNNSMNSIDDGKRQLNVNVTLNPVHSVNTDRSIDVRTNKSVISISTTSNYDQIRRFWKSNLSMFAAIGSNSTAGDRSQDYDYAYYDNSNESSEDDEVNTIAKAFAKLEKTINKKQKTVK